MTPAQPAAGPGQMSLGAVLSPTSAHIAGWRHRDALSNAGATFDDFRGLARIAENAKLDFVFLADELCAPDADPAQLSLDPVIYRYEPLTLASALSVATERVGIVVTQTTTYNEPYHIARKLASAERVRLIVADRAMAKHARAALVRAGVDVQQVDFLQARTNRSWTRDFVPSFVVSGKGQRPRRASALGARARDGVAAVKFRFNGWARYPNHREDEAAGQRVAEWVGVPAFEPSARVGNRPRRVVLEGGAIDVDGQGTLLTTEECLLDGRQARNPELGRAGSEQMLSAELGIDKVLWLERGIAGDDTGGHIDDFARFVAPATVVLAKEPRNRDPNHRVLEAARERLEGARDARGRS